MRSLGGNTHGQGCLDIGGGIAASDQRCSSPFVDGGAGTAPHPELEHDGAMGALFDPSRLRCDEGRVVEVVEERRLDDLSDGERSGHREHGKVGVDDPPFGDRDQLEPTEIAVVAQPREIVVVEQAVAGLRRQAGERSQLIVVEPGRDQPLDQGRETGGHTEAGLMGSVVGIGPEEVVEPSRPLGEAFSQVELSHDELVVIGEERSPLPHRHGVSPVAEATVRFAVHHPTRLTAGPTLRRREAPRAPARRLRGRSRRGG